MASPVGPVSGQTVQETQSDAPAFNIVDYKVHTIALASHYCNLYRHSHPNSSWWTARWRGSRDELVPFPVRNLCSNCQC